jgi:hypothetical protein
MLAVLRDDAFEAELAGALEDDLAVAFNTLAPPPTTGKSSVRIVGSFCTANQLSVGKVLRGRS